MRLSIATKVFLGFVAVLVCSAAVSGYGIVRLQRIGRGLSLLARPYMPLTRAISTLEAFQKERERSTDRLLEETDPRTRANLISLDRTYFARVVGERLTFAQQLVESPPIKGRNLKLFLQSRVKQLKPFPSDAAWSYQPTLPTRNAQAMLLHLLPSELLAQLADDLYHPVPLERVVGHRLPVAVGVLHVLGIEDWCLDAHRGVPSPGRRRAITYSIQRRPRRRVSRSRRTVVAKRRHSGDR